MRVLGIDPGTAIVGYGILDYIGNRFELVDYGCIFTDKNLPMEDRLLEIFNGLNSIIEKHKPTHMAIEELFFFKNSKTVISVGQARGVIVLTGRMNNIPMENYTPLQVKMGITGYGKAEKKQIQLMVQKILGLKEIPKPDDAADALAIAITHINSLSNSQFSLQKMNSLSSKEIKKEKISAKEFRELFMKS